jgi:hypothetical protein
MKGSRTWWRLRHPGNAKRSVHTGIVTGQLEKKWANGFPPRPSSVLSCLSRRDRKTTSRCGSSCTTARRFDALCRNAHSQQLLPVGFHQIEENLLGQLAVAGGSRRKKQHGIFFAHRIGLFDFTEQLRRIPELRLELGTNFFTHFITAAVNARTDRGLEITSPAAEVRRISPTPFSTMRFTVPRQPA